MPGIGERSDAVPRTAMPGHDEGETNGKGKKKSEAKRRQTQGSSAVRSGHGRASISGRRTSVGVPPRLLPEGLSSPGSASGQASWVLGKSAWPLTLAPTGERRPCAVIDGRYPPLPVPVQRRTSHPGRSAGGLMPGAARERVAKPPAACRPGHVRLTGGMIRLYVTEMGTNVKTWSLQRGHALSPQRR
jgi:hypothetical protein